MRVVGVWLEAGRMVWADAGELDLDLLDRVVVRSEDEDLAGRVHVKADQWLSDPDRVYGTVVRGDAESLRAEQQELPGADMPPLGSRVRAGEREAMVRAIDPVRRLVTIAPVNGEEVILPVDDVRA